MAKSRKPLVVVTRKLPDGIETRMCELFDTQLNLDDRPMTPGELAETVKRADVLVPTVTDRIDSSVLSKAGDKLKLIANYGNGVDHIDVATALSRGITVTNTPGVLTEDTADMTMALILAVPRRLTEGAGTAGHRLADPPHADDAEALAPDAMSEHPGGGPAGPFLVAGENRRPLGQPPRHRQDEGHRHVGGVLGEDAGRIGDGDAALNRGDDVYVVDTVAEIRD